VTDSTEDTAAGLNALASLSVGGRNTAVGFNALQATTEGGGNTAVGDGALEHTTTGSLNTAVGYGALPSQNDGIDNTAVGGLALGALSSGQHNTVVGQSAAEYLRSGTDNTIVGAAAMGSSQIGTVGLDGSRNTALGEGALFNNLGSDNIAIGRNAGIDFGNPNVSHNIAIGNVGMANDANIIRIGDGGPDLGGTHIETWLSGAVYGHIFVSTSDVNLKTDFREVEPAMILERLARLPVESWRFTTDSNGTRHIGPTAQDFYKAFALGGDDKHIVVTDEGGVALAAAKALNERLHDAQKELAREKALTARLQQELTALKSTVDQLITTRPGGTALPERP